MLANFLIGLREGLEATLVVSILIAYLVKTGHRDRLKWLGLGVAAAVVLSLIVGGVLTLTSNQLSDEAQEMFAGITSVVAVAFVTWMIFWMRRTARSIKGSLEVRLDHALAMGVGALFAVAFLSVGREGLETALFVWSAVQATGETAAPLIGVALGLAASVALGWSLYRGALRINLARFFTVTGILLVFVAAGVLAYGVHDLQEAGLIGGANTLAFDISSVISPSGLVGTVLKGLFNFQPDPTVAQVVVWGAYVVPVLWLFLRPHSRRPMTSSQSRDSIDA